MNAECQKRVLKASRKPCRDSCIYRDSETDPEKLSRSHPEKQHSPLFPAMVINDGNQASVKNDIPIADEVVVEEPGLDPIQETSAYKGRDQTAYNLSKQYFDTPRKVKIIVAGAGCSGLDLAHAVESGRLKNVELKIYEKNAGLGGTWFENRYPGCACDIPSHNYLVSKSGISCEVWYTDFSLVHLGSKPQLVVLLRVRSRDPRIP